MSPSMAIAPPIPVPSVTRSTFRYPTPTPRRISARSAMLASLSTTVVLPYLASTASLTRRLVPGRCGPHTRVPSSGETNPATPTPIAVTSSASTDAIDSRTASIGPTARSCSTTERAASVAPSKRTARDFVPPMSTPMVLMRTKRRPAAYSTVTF